MEVTVSLRWENATDRAEAAALLRRMADALGPPASPEGSRGAEGVPVRPPAIAQGWTADEIADLLSGCSDAEAAALVLLHIAARRSTTAGAAGITEAELCRKVALDEPGLYQALGALGRRHSAVFPDRPDLALTWTSGAERYWSMEPATAQAVLLGLLQFQARRGGAPSLPESPR